MLTKFIDPSYITVTFQQADLVISRAGMNTVTTLLMLNKPALFIPLSVSQHDEQKKNALFFKKHGLGEVADQNSLTSEKFLSLIHTMIKNRENYYNKVDTIELMVHKSAIDTIIQILSYAEKNSSQTETQKHS